MTSFIDPVPVRRARIGLVAGGLGAYWPQFPELLPQLKNCNDYVASRFEAMDCDVVNAGFNSDADDARTVAETLRRADCDLVVINLTTYLTSSQVLPIAQAVNVPILIIDLQPSEKMNHANFDTGRWLAYCGQCSLPEVANVFRRAGIDFRSVTGYLKSERAWARIDMWIRAARVRAVMRRARIGLMGHLYPGMLDVSTDMTLILAQFGSHVEVLEFDDLRVRAEAVTGAQVAQRVAEAKTVFMLDESVKADDLAWAAQVSLGLDALVADFRLDSLAYYHRGLGGELHERLGAGMIMGASISTARGVPMAGEYELRTSVAQLIAATLGIGGSFTELQALNFDDGVVEMGHDGPAHLAMSAHRPLLRGLGVYHGKRGYGVSVEFDVAPGPVTLFSIGQERDGRLVFIASEGQVVPGPLLQIGNTTSRVDFGRDPGEWVDEWASSGTGHHWALCLGSRSELLQAAAQLMSFEFRRV